MKEALKIKTIVHQAGKQNNCRIYDIYRHKDRLQVFIDKNSKDLNIQLKDCENVFRSLRFLLNLEMPQLLNILHLEISSPGLEKRLREKWHFEENIGKKIKITTHNSIKAYNTKTERHFFTQSFKAKLISFFKEKLHLKEQFREYSLNLSEVKFAQLIFEIEKITKQKKKHKTKNEVSYVS